MSSKKGSEVSVIITCQDEEGGTELSSEEYDQLVKVFVLPTPGWCHSASDDQVHRVRDRHPLEPFQGRLSLRTDQQNPSRPNDKEDISQALSRAEENILTLVL